MTELTILFAVIGIIALLVMVYASRKGLFSKEK